MEDLLPIGLKQGCLVVIGGQRNYDCVILNQDKLNGREGNIADYYKKEEIIDTVDS